MENLRGATLMVFAMFAFAVEDAIIKLTAETLPIGQILVILGVGGFALFASAVKSRGEKVLDPALLSTPVLLRGTGELIGTLGFVSAIVLTPLSSASAILQATPLVVSLGAALFLGETVGWRRWSAVIIGLFGVLLIIRPGMADFEPLSLLALIGVFGLAIRDLATRRVAPSISSMKLGYVGFLAILPGGLAHMWATGAAFVMPQGIVWGYIAAMLIIGVVASYAIAGSMRIGEVSFITPFRYSRLVFAMVLGVMVFDESIDAMTLLGSAIIVASGIYTVWRERARASGVVKPGSAG